MLYITQHERELRYGGPEEGGWWYDLNHSPKLVAMFPDASEGNDEQAYAACRGLNKELREAQDADPYHYDYTSVLGGHDTFYSVESEFGSQVTTKRPHYE